MPRMPIPRTIARIIAPWLRGALLKASGARLAHRLPEARLEERRQGQDREERDALGDEPVEARPEAREERHRRGEEEDALVDVAARLALRGHAREEELLHPGHARRAVAHEAEDEEDQQDEPPRPVALPELDREVDLEREEDQEDEPSGEPEHAARYAGPSLSVSSGGASRHGVLLGPAFAGGGAPSKKARGGRDHPALGRELSTPSVSRIAARYASLLAKGSKWSSPGSSR